MPKDFWRLTFLFIEAVTIIRLAKCICEGGYDCPPPKMIHGGGRKPIINLPRLFILDKILPPSKFPP